VCSGNPLTCQVADCEDEVKNQTETDVDCGGVCAPQHLCEPGQACISDSDCATSSCSGGVCDEGCGDCISTELRQGATNNPDQYLRPYPRLLNTGDEPIPLAELEIRYYFTNDGASSTHACNCWFAASPSSCNTLNMQVVETATSTVNADHYIRMTFPTSTQIIQIGGSAGVWEVGCHADDWYAFNQSNDYSYTGSTTFVVWDQVTVYQNGVLIWGDEP